MKLDKRDLARCRQIDEVCLGLPEATSLSQLTHSTYLARNKKFAYHLVDHHGDGRISLQTRGAPGENAGLAASDDRYFLPPYMAHHGWIGLWLDMPEFDPDEVEALIVASYRLQAPKTLVKALDA